MEISSRGNEYSGRLAPRDRRDYRSSRRRRNLWSIIIMLGTIVSCVTSHDAYLHAATPRSLQFRPLFRGRMYIYLSACNDSERPEKWISTARSRFALSLSLSVPGVKWVNLVRTVQSRHRDCASKSNWNIGNALPFRFHDFYSPSSAFALPSSTCTPTNFPRIPFLSLLRSPFFPFVPFFVLKPRQLVEHTAIKLESWNSEKSKQ